MIKKILNRNASWVLIARESASAYERSILGTAKSSRSVFELVRERILSEPCEVMYVLALDGTNRVTAMSEVARGGMHGCSVGAREILRVALMAGASGFILVHNHPSGNPLPSVEDIAMTKLVAEAGKVVGMPLLDHVIVGGWEKYSSFLDEGLLS